MRKKGIKYALLPFMATMLTLTLFAQTNLITGTVKDTAGAPIEGVSISVKGGKLLGTTGNDGSFSIAVNSDSKVLTFNLVGYASQDKSIENEISSISIVLLPAMKSGDEVVVTALGIKRERKALGYGVQELKGQVLEDAHEPNVTNALSGRVAGLQVVRSSGGPAASSKIILRGYTSLTGDNQPLIVVDGIPIDNTAGIGKNPGATNDYWNPSLDMGNGLADINPDDIASVSILKGPASAALYGSRAGNGAIIITTKSGSVQKGLGISLTSSVGMEKIFTGPEMQTSFGQGSTNIYNPIGTSSWGPEITGQKVTNWAGKDVNLEAYNNVKNYFNTGFNINENIAFSQQFKSTSIYSSFGRLDNKSMIPGAKLGRTNLMTHVVSHFGTNDKWTLDVKVQYINSKATNRPQAGNNGGNVYRGMYLMPVSLDIRDFKAAKDSAGDMLWYLPNSASVNPYWASKYVQNADTRNRFIMNASLKYQFTDWLNAEVKGGADMYNTTADTRTYAGSPLTNQYGYGKSSFSEVNYSALVTAKKDDVWGKLGGYVTLGSNLMSRSTSSLSANSGALEVPDLFSINNGVKAPSVREGYYNKKINSLYGSAQVNWDGYLFLEETVRNDWTSALAPNHRSYLYISTNLSYVFTDMINRNGGSLPSWLSYGKLRASAAQAGNDMDPYKLYNTYSIGKDPNGNTTASRGNTLYNPNVVNELIKTYELGAELRLFKSRLGIDFSWYKTNATNQLLPIALDPLSGYSFRMINAGNIESKGIEVVLNGKILEHPDGFNWDMQVNFSKNNNMMKALAPDVDKYTLGGFDVLSVVAQAGKKYGEIYGTTFVRVNDPASSYNGQLLLSDAGLPQQNSTPKDLGNQQANFLLGTTQTFSYKNVSLSFLLDGRFGGKIFSATLANMQALGTAAQTVQNGKREDMIVSGVVSDGNGGYISNTKPITTQQYWQAIQPGNIGISEANLYDATNVRLRNVQLSYNFSKKAFGKSGIQGASLGLSCNNVWLISSHMHGIDPESVYAVGSNAVGFENGAPPTSRYFMFNLRVNF